MGKRETENVVRPIQSLLLTPPSAIGSRRGPADRAAGPFSSLLAAIYSGFGKSQWSGRISFFTLPPDFRRGISPFKERG